MQEKWYHGTLTRHALAIIKNGIKPDINISNELDFGYGFYLGDKHYAKTIAKDKHRGAKQDKDFDAYLDSEALLVYHVDFEGLLNDHPDGLVFRSKNRECLNTIFECRKNIGERSLNVPFVLSPLADGRLQGMMDWYKANPSKFKESILKINYWIPTKHKQIVVKDIDVLKWIRFDSFYRKENGVWVKN